MADVSRAESKSIEGLTIQDTVSVVLNKRKKPAPMSLHGRGNAQRNECSENVPNRMQSLTTLLGESKSTQHHDRLNSLTTV